MAWTNMTPVKTDLANVKVGEEISSIDEIVDGYKTYQVLRAALELGLFEWLDEHGPSSREEIGNALSINGMFTRSFFQTLAELGFLSGNDDRFGNTDLAARLLVKGSPAYQGDWILNASQVHGQWDRLKDTLTSREPKIPDFRWSGPGVPPGTRRTVTQGRSTGGYEDPHWMGWFLFGENTPGPGRGAWTVCNCCLPEESRPPCGHL